MNVLITGATGYIGRAVAQAVHSAGHNVHALAHSAGLTEEVMRSGWTPVHGDLCIPDELEKVARRFDAVVHVAHTGGPDAGRFDREASMAFLRALAGTGRRFIYTSGVWVLGEGRTDETSAVRPAELIAWRGQLEREILAAAPGVSSVVIRPGIVYGRNGGIPAMIAKGDLPIIAPGTQHWALVHVDDLAQLYVRALSAPAGSILNGVSTRLRMRDLALLATAHKKAGLTMINIDEARARFGTFADALSLDQDPSAEITRRTTGWVPQAPTPIEELLAGTYDV